MTFTNRHNLPEVLIRALEKADAEYDGNNSDRTVSSLHEPPRAVLLKQKFKGSDETAADVSERVNSLLGTAFHKVCEMAAGEGDTVEVRYSDTVMGWDISGKVDNYHEATGHLRDWKVLSVWSVTIGDAINEYTKKLNTYAHLLRANKKPVERLSIVVLFRDYSAREARRNPDYPQRQVIEYDLDLWSPEEASVYVSDLVGRHQAAQVAFDLDGTLPNCTPDERWAKPDTWAVFKGANKRATKVCVSRSEAEQTISSTTQGMRIEHRPGEMVKCMHYCGSRAVCEVGKSLEMKAEEAF